MKALTPMTRVTVGFSLVRLGACQIRRCLGGAALLAGLLAQTAWTFNISEDWRWKVSSLGTAPARGTAIKVCWSVPPDGTLVNGGGTGINSIHATLSAKFGAGYFDFFRYMAGRLGAVSGLEFVESADDGSTANGAPGVYGAHGDIRIIGRDLGGGYAWCNMPSTTGSCLLQVNTVIGAGWDYWGWVNVTMHELTHASGLAHQRVYVDASATDPDLNGTLMGICNSDGPQFDDVYALNRLYGDKLERNGGNDSLPTATDLGNVSAGAKALGLDAGPLRLGNTASDFVSIDGSDDVDTFKFRLDEPGGLSVRVTPKGPIYDYAPEGGARISFNASAQNDLWFDLLDASGRQVAHVDSAGLGGAEVLASLVVAGDYYLRMGGKQDSAQFYRLDVAEESLAAYRLPFIETFDNFPTNMAHVVGPVYGQHGWEAEPQQSAAVQSDNVYAGQKAVALTGGALRHPFVGNNVTNAWFDFVVQALQTADGDSFPLQQESSVAFYVNASGQIVAQSGAEWRTCDAFTAASNEWIRISTKLNYSTRKWSLYAAHASSDKAAVRVARDLDFVMGSTNLKASAFCVTSGGGEPTCLDNLAVTDEAVSGVPGYLDRGTRLFLR